VVEKNEGGHTSEMSVVDKKSHGIYEPLKEAQDCIAAHSNDDLIYKHMQTTNMCIHKTMEQDDNKAIVLIVNECPD
jgi:hypothetical protein